MIRKQQLRFGALAVAILMAGGCLDSVEPPETFAWSGELVASAGAPIFVSGQVAVLRNLGVTTISIGLSDAPAGSRFGWGVREGPCDGSGDPLVVASVFGVLEEDEEGEFNRTIEIGRRLDGTATLSAEVFAEPDGTGAVLACADLDREI
jgi:hypothetical protein